MFQEFRDWILACRIEYQNNSVKIVAVYRSPNYTKAEFYKILNWNPEEISVDHCDIFINGYFNREWAENTYNKNKIESNSNYNELIDEFIIRLLKSLNR